MSSLKNGAQVIEVATRRLGGHVVLAQWNGHLPFVTWRMDENGNTFLGHYFATITEAVADFNQRIA